jgi:hypothetical protein
MDARLPLAGNEIRIGDPLSGSYLGPAKTKVDANKAVTRFAVCSSFSTGAKSSTRWKSDLNNVRGLRDGLPTATCASRGKLRSLWTTLRHWRSEDD